MSFIHPGFLLETETARRLYDEYAAPQPRNACVAGVSPTEEDAFDMRGV